MTDHQWIIVAYYAITNEEAEQAASGESVVLSRETLQEVAGPGCSLCEQSWRACHDKPCPGQPV